MKPRIISGPPVALSFGPLDITADKEPLLMTVDELEALRLVDYEGLMQEEAAIRMGVSRGTVWRCLSNARMKMAAVLVEGRGLNIDFDATADVDGATDDKMYNKKV
jgi:uncharacterized protein